MIYASPFFMKAELIPAFDLLDRAGGTLADALLLLLMIGIVTLGVVIVKMFRRSMNNMQAQQTAALDLLRENTEKSFASLQQSMKDLVRGVSEKTAEDVSAIRGILEELKQDKMWTETCAERHEKIDDKFYAIDEWRKETVDTLKRHEDRIFALGRRE